VFLWYVRNHGLFCFCNLGFEKLAWRRSVPGISLIYCKVTVWLLTFNFIHFMAAFWAVFTFRGSGPALTAHGSLDLKQEIQIQIQTVLCSGQAVTLVMLQCCCLLSWGTLYYGIYGTVSTVILIRMCKGLCWKGLDGKGIALRLCSWKMTSLYHPFFFFLLCFGLNWSGTKGLRFCFVTNLLPHLQMTLQFSCQCWIKASTRISRWHLMR
jgi:hypothetical protein